MTTTDKATPILGPDDGLRYKPLQDTHIRLLNLFPSLTDEDEIRCSLESFALEDPPPYTALSYTWGDANKTRNILVDDQTFKATENLEAALKHLRDGKKSFRFWVDAICIKQDDDDEKKHQLQLMPNIFSRARETRVWLGPKGDDSDRAINLIRRLSNHHVESSADVKYRGL